MDLNFLSGLLLVIVVVAAVVYMIKELMSDRAGSFEKAREVTDRLAKHVGSETKPVNEHLIGEMGTVIAHSDDSARPMRVRLSVEQWSARLSSAEQPQLPIGASVKVTAVDGPVLVVEPSTEAAASPDA